jgi:3-chloro-4-hydroxyphenylacetate reductive dehalogenase
MSGYHERNPEPFPMHTLKRVDRPTTVIHDDQVTRVDEREGGFHRARRGDFGPVLKREVTRFVPKHPTSGALLWMTQHLMGVVDGVVATAKAPVPDDPALLTRHIKELAYFLRADAVGICKLPRYAVFTHKNPRGEPIELNHSYAIAILIDQDSRTSRATTGNDWISNSMSFLAYSTSAFISCVMADYIRRLGFPARAHHALNYQVVVPPILLWACLGEMCRIGDCVLHPFLGPRFKAAVVTTNLPLQPDKPIDFGLQDFCSKCMKCARECPSGALSTGGKIIHNGYERWPSDVERCTGMRVGNKRGSGCGVCIKVCPWNKPYTPFHRGVNWMMRHSSLARRVAIAGDDLMGYGKPHPEDQWWFDLDEVDGAFVVPRNRHRSD